MYDGLGRQTSASTDGGLPATTLASQFDKDGNRTQLDAAIGSVADFENTYGYDQLNRMTGVTQTNQTASGHNSVAYKQVNFGYNGTDQLTLINRFDHSVTGSNAFSTSTTVDESSGPLARSTYSYDTAGNLHTITQDRISGANDGTLTWTHYTDNKVHTFASPVDGTGTISYTYDQDNQLTESSAGSGVSDQTYAYNDANGNRTSTNSVSATIGAGNRLTNDGTYRYYYDAEGNLTRREEISTGSYRNLTYDNRNRLTEVEDFPPELSASPTQKIDYGYDAFNRRVSREVTIYTTTEGSNDGGEGGDSTTTSSTYTEKFIYDGDHVVLDFLSTDSSATVPHSRYLYGPAIDQVLAQETSSGTFWLLADNQGSIRDVLTSTGAAVTGGHFKYDAFGNVLSGNENLGRYFFTGRELDTLTGLQYNRERWYDSSTGRFITHDPIGLQPDSNPYRYVGNSPTNATDPNGTDAIAIGLGGGLTAAEIIAELAAGAAVAAPAAVCVVGIGATYGSYKFSDAYIAPLVDSTVSSLLQLLSDASAGAGDEVPLTDDQKKVIKGLQKQIDKHAEKLKEYIENPEACDNKGFLQNVSEELKQKIIQARIKSLTDQINNFHDQINKILGGG